MQTPIHQEIEKMEDLLSRPTILGYSQLYPYQLYLSINIPQKINHRTNCDEIHIILDLVLSFTCFLIIYIIFKVLRFSDIAMGIQTIKFSSILKTEMEG